TLTLTLTLTLIYTFLHTTYILHCRSEFRITILTFHGLIQIGTPKSFGHGCDYRRNVNHFFCGNPIENIDRADADSFGQVLFDGVRYKSTLSCDIAYSHAGTEVFKRDVDGGWSRFILSLAPTFFGWVLFD